MSAGSDNPALLSIGVASGGMSPENHLVFDALGALGRTVVRERERFSDEGLRVNIVFHIPGPIFQPDYEGVHATRFDRKNNHFLVVAAVPADLTPEELPTYIAETLQATAREAREFVAKRKLAVTLEQVEKLIDYLVADLETAAH
jgi:hypothetical protein